MRRYAFVFALVALLVAGAASAQSPTGLLTGNVTDGQAPLPGVTITVTSPNQQGTRTGVTNENGDYILRLLPPGEYRVVFTLEGFQTIETTVKVSAAQTSTVNALMPAATIAEEITVTGTLETVSATSVSAATATKQLVDDLPIGRTLAAAVFTAPGTAQIASIGNNVTISGGQTYENLWLVNGVVVNENVRQQALPLFIEDAIQETTTQTAGVSAEYGRFAGGVVTSITKSGGNQFSGSLRFNFDNPSWNDVRPFETEGADKTNTTLEATLGGYVVKDKLWFFAAYRDIGDRVTSNETSQTVIAYDTVGTNERLEGKITWSITPEHRLIGSYFNIDSSTQNDWFGTIMDLRSLYNREDPQYMYAFNYNGVFSDNFFLEAQYSKRDYIISKGGGGLDNSEVGGTLLLDQSRGSRRYWAPTFCGSGPPVCPDKQRDNENYLIKGSWFASTPSLGSHDISFGYDHYQEFNLEENHQSASDYRIYTSGAYIDRDPIVPIIRPRGQSRGAYFYYQPQLTPSVGSKMVTDSIFVNDRWRLNNNWSFNIGFRYDKNDGTDSGGQQVAKDSRISPRLGVSWDPKGDGDWLLSATASRYVTSIVGTGNVGDGASQAGLTSVYLWYTGPEINTDPNSLVSTEVALQQFFDWLRSVGGAFEWAENSANWRYNPSYPGLTPVLLESLDSPYVDEYNLSVAKRLGSRGTVRFDYVHREFASFYQSALDLTTGIWTNPAGKSGDRIEIRNEDTELERKFDGFYLTGTYRLGDSVTLGGNYTYSESKGNFIGETANNGPIRSSDLQYPEYTEARWHYPVGWLEIDQRHRLRVWGAWDIFRASWHRLNLGFVDSYSTGTPYSAVADINPTAYVTNPGYLAPDTSQAYYFSGRGEYRWDDINSLDLSLTYAFTPKMWGRTVEFYIKPEVRNVLDEQGQISGETNVDTNFDQPGTYSAFNPFTDTPVEGVNWGKDARFGQPTQASHYQAPRTYLLAVGMRL